MDKYQLTEREICTKFITPALEKAGCDIATQVREEFALTKGRIIVRGKLHTQAQNKRADGVLFHRLNMPIAVIEAKDNQHSLGDGMQLGLGYAEMLQVPFFFSSNGDGFLFHNKIAKDGVIERELALHEIPSPDTLWQWWSEHLGLNSAQSELVSEDSYSDVSNKSPRYYQLLAINKTIEAIAKGQNRILLVMATGTGKTYTAFQIIWRLWKSKAKKRILFLADRSVPVDLTMTNDFKPFGSEMTKIQKQQANKSYEIYPSLYQAVTGTEEESNIYKQLSRDFFDLIVIDECHRGSAAADCAWREILEYFSAATQIGLTATPRGTKEVSNIDYFGVPIYTYLLRQGIDDGFFAPYKVVRINLDKDLAGWRPNKGMLDKHGKKIEGRIYNQRDFDKNLVLEKRTELVANKTIVFCDNIDHAERMRQALAKVFDITDAAAKTGHVLMSRHSASTIACAKESVINLFEFDGDKVALAKVNEADVNKSLSASLITFSDSEARLNIQYVLKNTARSVLSTQGITDEMILETAWAKLYPTDNRCFEIQNTLSCGFQRNLVKDNALYQNHLGRTFVSLFDFDEAYNDWNQLGQDVQTDPALCLAKKRAARESYAPLLSVASTGQIHQQGINPRIGGNYGNKSLLTIELLFHSIGCLDAYFTVDTERKDGFIKFTSDSQKVTFVRDVVPAIDAVHFAVFQPLFEFIKSKCVGGVAP